VIDLFDYSNAVVGIDNLVADPVLDLVVHRLDVPPADVYTVHGSRLESQAIYHGISKLT
jgi:hypothetical protein